MSTDALRVGKGQCFIFYEICSYLPYSIARFRPRPIIKLFPARCSCGNQVTRLVNRMEVLSEELHPP